MMHLNYNRPVTVFTWMQYDSNRRWYPQTTYLPRENVFRQSKMTPKNKMSAKKYCTINFTHLIHKACQILSTFTNQYNCLHLHSQCLHPPHTHSYHSHPLHCHSTTHHQSHTPHWIYSTFEYPSQLLLMRCCAMLLWSTLTKYQIYISWFINLLEPMKTHSVLQRWC
jgi:hypothetical protein